MRELRHLSHHRKTFLNAYNKLFEKGYKKIISIHPSSKLSGTIQAAKVGRSLTNRENDIELIDSLGASLLQGFLVLGADRKISKGRKFYRNYQLGK